MSLSLLLALLEAHEDQESDRSRDYFAWLGAIWNGEKWLVDSQVPEVSAREEIIMRELYDVLQSTIQTAISEPEKKAGTLGTVLARALTDDPRPVDSGDLRALRALLRPELHKRFDALIKRHGPAKPLGAKPE